MNSHVDGARPHAARDPHTAGSGATVLDIGDDVGALVLYTSAEMGGAEIEISLVGGPLSRQHVAVHPRAGGPTHAAVYPNLPEGSYELWAADGSVALRVQIEGGSITETRWPQTAVTGASEQPAHETPAHARN
jgi:hypothetical protein